MAQKITLNELRRLVKQVINENENFFDSDSESTFKFKVTDSKVVQRYVFREKDESIPVLSVEGHDDNNRYKFNEDLSKVKSDFFGEDFKSKTLVGKTITVEAIPKKIGSFVKLKDVKILNVS